MYKSIIVSAREYLFVVVLIDQSPCVCINNTQKPIKCPLYQSKSDPSYVLTHLYSLNKSLLRLLKVGCGCQKVARICLLSSRFYICLPIICANLKTSYRFRLKERLVHRLSKYNINSKWYQIFPQINSDILYKEDTVLNWLI